MTRRRHLVKVSRLAALAIAATLAAACAGGPSRPVEAFNLETPRPFGYQIGDTIPMRVVVQTRPGVQLQPASLPKPGPLNRWLNLRRIELAEAGDGEYRIELEYQVFYAPLEVKALTIPGFALRFSQYGQTVEESVPPWQFTVAPLRELIARQDEAGEYLRPDQAPALLATASVRTNLALSLLAAVMLGLKLARQYGYLPWFARRSPFKTAERRLRQLPPGELAAGLAALHSALNATHGTPVFGHRLQDFLSAHPEFGQASAELAWFFDYSNRYFFSGQRDEADTDLVRLQKLCSLCRAIERGSR